MFFLPTLGTTCEKFTKKPTFFQVVLNSEHQKILIPYFSKKPPQFEKNKNKCRANQKGQMSLYI